MSTITHPTKVTCVTLEGSLETVKRILDSEGWTGARIQFGGENSYWEGRDCLRLVVHNRDSKQPMFSMFASVTEDTLTLLVEEYDQIVTHRFMAQIPGGAIFSTIDMFCIATFK